MPQISNPPVGGVKVFPSNAPSIDKKETKTSHYDQFTKCKENWGYGRDALKITQGMMNGTGEVCHELKPILSDIGDKLAFTSIISIPFAVDGIVNGVKKMIGGGKIRDYFGVTLASIGTFINVGDLCSYSITFINTVCKVVSLPAIKVLGKISPILGISLCSLTILSRNFQLFNHAKFKWKVSKIDMNQDDRTKEIFNAMIAKDSRLTELKAKNSDPTHAIEKYKAKKIAILKRTLNDDLVAKICHLQKNVLSKRTLTDADRSELDKTIKSVNRLANRKIFSCLMATAVTGCTLAGLVILFLNAAPIIIVGSVLTALTCCKLGIAIYENKFINKNL